MSNNQVISDIDVKDVIVDMAKILNTDYEEENNEYSIRIPDDIGKGFVKGIKFSNGVGVLETVCLLKKKLKLELGKGVVNPLKIVFNRDCKFLYRNEEDGSSNEVERLECFISSGSIKNHHIFVLPADKPISIFSIEINRKQFEEKVDLLLSEMDQELEMVFRDVNGVNSFFYKSQYSLDISEKIDEFEDTEMSGFLKAVHSEGKVYEILTYCLKQYLDDLNAPEKRTIFRKVTLDKIEEAVKIIKDEIDTIGNIITLSRRVGINQNTLQSGFKRFYNVSVNEFIRNCRMDKAKELLLNTDLNITEITYKIGINSRSYFSKLFKEKYGMSPKVFQNKNREGSETYKTA